MYLDKIKAQLLSLQDKKYQEFSRNLSPSANEIIGIRIPVLRELSKEIFKENPYEFLDNNDYSYFELIFLQGFVISKIKDYSIAIKYIEEYVNHIIDWATCDTFVSSIKIVKKNKEEFFKFLMKQLEIKDEYHQRFVSICLMCYYIDDKYLTQLFKIIPTIDISSYYSHMGVAWLIATMLIKKYDETLSFLLHSNLDKKTYNKAIQKAIESNCLSKETKDYLRTLKQK